MKTKKKIKFYSFDDLHNGYMKDPEYKKAYEDLQPEFKLIKALIIARAKHGLTQRQLAKRIGVPQSSLARFESGRVTPTLPFMKRVASGLGLGVKVTIS
jgi:DNA-binding XRE family transcriptional regulator